jgi:hypothetical protein
MSIYGVKITTPAPRNETDRFIRFRKGGFKKSGIYFYCIAVGNWKALSWYIKK